MKKYCFICLSLAIFFNLLALKEYGQTTLGSVTDFETNKGEYTFTSNSDKVKVMFYTDNIFRIWLGTGGTFTDNNDIVVYKQPQRPAFQQQFKFFQNNYEKFH